MLNYWQIYLDNVEEINLSIEAGGRLFISSMDIVRSSYHDRNDTGFVLDSVHPDLIFVHPDIIIVFLSKNNHVIKNNNHVFEQQ